MEKMNVKSNLCNIIVDLLFGFHQGFSGSNNFRFVDRISVVVLDRDLIVRLLDVHQSCRRKSLSGPQQENSSNEALKIFLIFLISKLFENLLVLNLPL